MTVASARHPADDCLGAARDAAKLAREAYRAIVPVADGLTGVSDRVGPVSPMRPASPLLEAVATLSMANSAGQRALELMQARSEAAQLAEGTAALYESARAARLGVLALTAGRYGRARMQLAHAEGYACHLITEAMVVYESSPSHSRQNPRGAVSRAPFPQGWRSLVSGLGEVARRAPKLRHVSCGWAHRRHRSSQRCPAHRPCL